MPTIATGLITPAGLALSATTLYVADRAAGTVRTYNAATGLVLGVPEPSTWAPLGVSAAGAGSVVLRGRRARA